MIFRTGDKVKIIYGARIVSGAVALASENGQSLFLEFEALLGGHAGGMPVLQVEGSEFESIITGERVTLAPCGDA